MAVTICGDCGNVQCTCIATHKPQVEEPKREADEMVKAFIKGVILFARMLQK